MPLLSTKRGLGGALVLCLALSEPAFATVPPAPGGVPASPIASVGARLDAALSPTGATHPRSALPWRALDAAAYAKAKADAQRRAARSVTSYRRNDFAIRADPASQPVARGASITYTVTTQPTSGSAQTVSLSVGGLPSASTGTFNPPSIIAGESSTLTVATTAATPAGTFTLTITGAYRSPPTTHSTIVTLIVTAPAADDFSISASPASQSVVQGSSTTYTVSTAVTSGAAQPVTFSLSGAPSGATGTFNPTSVTAGGTATLTVTTTPTTATGSFTLTIAGSGPGATHTAEVSLTVSAPSSGPTLGVSWNGQAENDLAPPDPTGAIGSNSYIELINLRYGIYARDGAVINEGDLGALTLFPVSELSDPQIVWDPTAERFYYLALDFYTSEYAFGYSKSANPQASTDFCHYSIGAFYSSLYLPDYPKMAVTPDFVLVGTNVFLLAAFYNGSDVDWFQKPTDPVCPSRLGAGGIFGDVRNVDGTQTSTPEPAVAADATSGGWIVGSADVGVGSADYLTLFRVTKNSSSGYAQISSPMRIGVASYEMPANAPQHSAAQLLDTMDTRLTHAVAGFDPRIGATAVWTAHAVFGGAGSEDRWYEITTAGTPQLSQSGRVSDPALYVWNGAISSDRAADDAADATALTGRNMLMGFNTSSADTYPAIQMVSQHGAGIQSGFVLVKQSAGPNVDFSCTGGSGGNVCRWGDYAGAVPDPLRSSGGQVWLSAEWNNPATDNSTPTWQTWNWSATP